MVGIPRSKGCRICVQRRVKCDLTRPTCNNCAKGNRPCPGYDSNLRIHDEGTKLRKKFGHNGLPIRLAEGEPESPASSTSGHSQTYTTVSSPEEILELVAQSTVPDEEAIEALINERASKLLPAYNSFFHFLEVEITPSPGSKSMLNMPAVNSLLDNDSFDLEPPFDFTLHSPIHSPFMAQEQLLNTFAAAIASAGPQALPKQMQNHYRWLSQLPLHFGKKLLDNSVRAVTMVHLGRITKSDVFIHESRRFYGHALRLLNNALTDEDLGMASETLSATVLLSFYEMFASNSNDSWLRHAGGAGMLMRLRGPARHRYGLDRDVYLAYRHTIVIEAFEKDEECFLARPEWLELARLVHEDLRRVGISPERRELFDMGEEFYMEHVHIPRTFRDARNLPAAAARLSLDEFQAHQEEILERTRQHRYRLKSIHVRFRAALSKTGLQTTSRMTGDKVFPVQYVYVNVFIASTSIGHWTIMILLNFILKEAEQYTHPERTGLYLMDNQEMAMEICRTTPFMLTSSFLGPFFSIFALRLCLLIFGPGEERSWVIRKLGEIGATRMSMAADIPEFHADTVVRKSIEGPTE